MAARQKRLQWPRPCDEMQCQKPNAVMNSQERTHYNFIILMTFTSPKHTACIHVLAKEPLKRELFMFCAFCNSLLSTEWINDNHYYHADRLGVLILEWNVCAPDNNCGANQLTKQSQLSPCALSLLPSLRRTQATATKSYHYVNWAYALRTV